VPDREALLRAAAANHRAWFRRVALAAGGRVERFGAWELTTAGRGGMLAFPRSRARGPLDEVVERILRLRLGGVGCWSLREDHQLGTLLVARGFQWGRRPHWMALDLTAPVPDGAHAVVRSTGAYPQGLPNASCRTSAVAASAGR
jgi:hypothetical protein